MRHVRMLAAGIGMVCVLVLGLPAAQANDIAEFDTQFATDVAYAGLGGLRNNGTGTLEVSGVSGSVTRALLYWQGPTNSAAAAANANVTFDGAGVTGTNIGVSDNNCWGFLNSQGYRADVTSLVSGNGNYPLSNFTKADANINGVSLIVFYDDGDVSNNRDVVIFDGNDSNVPGNAFDADGWNASLAGINYTSGDASLDIHYADTQIFNDGGLLVNGSPLASSPELLNGSTVPNAGFFEGLWDIKQYPELVDFLSPGLNTLDVTTDGTFADCVSLIVLAVNLPAGAAPNQPPTTATTVAPVPEPAPPATAAPAVAARPVAARPAFTG